VVNNILYTDRTLFICDSEQKHDIVQKKQGDLDMKNGKLDRRSQKTNYAIQEALFSLMQKKQYGRITIQNIIDSANVGRSTFYSHYSTKDELFLACIQPMLDVINIDIGKYIESGEAPSQSVLELFEHIEQNSRVVKGLIKAENSGLFFDRIVIHFDNQAQLYLKQKFKGANVAKIPLPILTHHIYMTLVALVKWWLNNNMPYSSEKMCIIFQELINPCLNTFRRDVP